MPSDESSWSLYKHTSPSGKVYIGIAKDVRHRWRAQGRGYIGSNRIWYAIQKYGWDNFKHEILADGLTREEASEMEKEMIAKYNSTDTRYGYNLTCGGYDGAMCEESRKKLSESLMGHPVSERNRRLMSERVSIPVICLDTGVTYKSARDAGEQLGICSSCIGKNCNGLAMSAGGMHFAKLSDYEQNTIPVFKPKPVGYRVMCLETGKIYETQTEAAKDYGVTSQAVSHCCTGKTKTAAGMHWKIVEEEEDA